MVDAERLEHLLRALPPAPTHWVADARELIQTMASEQDGLLGQDVHGAHHEHLDDLPDLDGGQHSPDLHGLSDPHDQGHHGHEDHDGDAW